MSDAKPRSTYEGPPATLADHAAQGFRLKPRCRRCWHEGMAMTPQELAERYHVPMTTSHPAIEKRLVCVESGERAGYLQIENPAVTGRGQEKDAPPR